MIHGLRRRVRSMLFAREVRDVYRTAPLVSDPQSPVLLVSQVCHRDVAMYLLAVKSLARFLRPRGIVILDDTTLTGRDRALLRAHVPCAEIMAVPAVSHDCCPRGKTWERLLLISDLIGSGPVIQVDSDTLTLLPPKEVETLASEGTSFALGEWEGQEIGPVSEASEVARRHSGPGGQHVQIIAESHLDQLPAAPSLKYFRGSSGFAGFAKGSFSRQAVNAFSQQIEKLIGREKWDEWGSEQVTSNFFVANSPRAAILPFPRYCHHHPGIDGTRQAFLHFVGPHRYHAGRYATLARQVLEELRR